MGSPKEPIRGERSSAISRRMLGCAAFAEKDATIERPSVMRATACKDLANGAFFLERRSIEFVEEELCVDGGAGGATMFSERPADRD